MLYPLGLGDNYGINRNNKTIELIIELHDERSMGDRQRFGRLSTRSIRRLQQGHPTAESQSGQTTCTQGTPETPAKRTESDNILQSILYLKNTYEPTPKEDAKPIPSAKVA